jgi:hypothetical protein
MKMLFVFGPPAAGKFTIARKIAEQTGWSLFHNHLVVDAVMAVFPFGSPSFVVLREEFWLRVIAAAASENRSLIFTYLPEASVAPDFPHRAAQLVADHGGECVFVRLALSLDRQLERIANADRAKFGKLRDPQLLRELHAQFEQCEARMPPAAITIDTAKVTPSEAAAEIAALV